MARQRSAPHNTHMLDVHALKTEDLKGLSPSAMAEVAARMLAHIGEQSRHIGAQAKQLDRQGQAIKFKDAKIERITFELARLKASRVRHLRHVSP